jgi:hypothetical protein
MAGDEISETGVSVAVALAFKESAKSPQNGEIKRWH